MKRLQVRPLLSAPCPGHPYRVATEREEAQLRRKLLRKLAAACISDLIDTPSAKGGSFESENGRRTKT